MNSTKKGLIIAGGVVALLAGIQYCSKHTDKNNQNKIEYPADKSDSNPDYIKEQKDNNTSKKNKKTKQNSSSNSKTIDYNDYTGYRKNTPTEKTPDYNEYTGYRKAKTTDIKYDYTHKNTELNKDQKANTKSTSKSAKPTKDNTFVLDSAKLEQIVNGAVERALKEHKDVQNTQNPDQQYTDEYTEESVVVDNTPYYSTPRGVIIVNGRFGHGGYIYGRSVVPKNGYVVPSRVYPGGWPSGSTGTRLRHNGTHYGHRRF